MRWYEFMLDKFSQTKLFEMAMSRDKAKNSVISYSPQIIRHLIKIFVFEAPESSSHWASEINSWLLEIDDITLKPNNRKIDKQTLYQWLIYDSAPTYNAAYVVKWSTNFKDNGYATLPMREFDPEEIINQIKLIIERVCSDISLGTFKSIRDYI